MKWTLLTAVAIIMFAFGSATGMFSQAEAQEQAVIQTGHAQRWKIESFEMERPYSDAPTYATILLDTETGTTFLLKDSRESESRHVWVAIHKK